MTIVLTWAMFKWVGIPLFILTFISVFYLISLIASERYSNPVKLTCSFLAIILFAVWLLAVIVRGLIL